MQVIKKRAFINSLKAVLLFISDDKPSASIEFYNNLEQNFALLADNPLMYKRSIYFETQDYRDMVYQGYTIIYKISNDKILILDIFKWQKYSAKRN